MSELARNPMSLEEFLRWDDRTDIRHELIAGFPVATAPAARAHGILCARLAAAIDAALSSRRPCTAQTEAGIARRDREDSCYVADIAVSCHPFRRGEQLVTEPVLIVEILSPGTERRDRQIKIPAYRAIESVQEILLIDSETWYAEVLRRDGDQWITNLVRGRDAVRRLASVDLSVSLAQLYDGIDIEPEADPNPASRTG